MVAETQTNTTLDEVKAEILTYLRDRPDFTQAPYEDLQFSSLTGDRILLYQYQDYSDNRCLVINIAVPDEAYPRRAQQEILDFMNKKAKPVVNALSNLQIIKDLAFDYYLVKILLRSQTEFDRLKR
jgi:hypothetical protein